MWITTYYTLKYEAGSVKKMGATIHTDSLVQIIAYF